MLNAHCAGGFIRRYVRLRFSNRTCLVSCETVSWRVLASRRVPVANGKPSDCNTCETSSLHIRTYGEVVACLHYVPARKYPCAMMGFALRDFTEARTSWIGVERGMFLSSAYGNTSNMLPELGVITR